jgi:hypothetical protein
MENIDQVVTAVIVSIIRGVGQGQSRDALEAKVASLKVEAAFESGWDNSSTASDLRWEADINRMAAEARTPRDGDTFVESIKKQVRFRLHDIVTLKEDYYAEGELIQVNRDDLWSATVRAIEKDNPQDFTLIDTLIDEFASRGEIDNPDEIKRLHREEVGLTYGVPAI